MDEYPNWRIPLSDEDGKPVFLEDLVTHPGLRAIADAVGDYPPTDGTQM
jgi:4-alpha-glucanotransferase